MVSSEEELYMSDAAERVRVMIDGKHVWGELV